MTTSTVKPGLSAALASPYTPIAVINGTPIYAMQGGRAGGIQIVAGDADGDDDDELLDGDEDDDSDEGDEPDEDEEDLPRGRRRKPAEDDRAAAMERMEAALKKANSEAARNRRAGRALERLGISDLATWLTERGIDPETGLPYGEDVVDPNDLDGDEELIEERPRRDSKKSDRETVRAVRAAASAAEARARELYVPILAQQAATIALRDAGFRGTAKQMDKILRLIDPEELEVVLDAGEFEILGIDEAVAAIQDDFPVLFGATTDDDEDERPARRRAPTKTTGTGRARTTRGARDVDGGDRGKPAPKKGGWMDQLVKQMDQRGR